MGRTSPPFSSRSSFFTSRRGWRHFLGWTLFALGLRHGILLHCALRCRFLCGRFLPGHDLPGRNFFPGRFCGWCLFSRFGRTGFGRHRSGLTAIARALIEAVVDSPPVRAPPRPLEPQRAVRWPHGKGNSSHNSVLIHDKMPRNLVHHHALRRFQV